MRKLRLIIITLTVSFFATSSHAQGKIEVFGGYSYVRPAFSQTETSVCMLPVCPGLVYAPTTITTHPNLNGWGFSGAYMLLPWLGAKADFGGQYGAALESTSANIHTFLFGPEVRWPARVSPFAHVLFGGAHASSGTGTVTNNPPYNVIPSASESGFASAFGLGIDAKIKSLFWVRLIQVDDLMTRFYASTQNRPRVSAGVVVRF